MATIDEIKQQAAAVKNATQVGENTAERVGGALAGLAEIAEQQDSKLSGLSDKVAIKDEEGTVVETPFRYIQSEEFIFAKVDVNDRLLFGIHWDGTPVFGKTSAVEDRLQTQVTLLAEKVATIMGDDDTTNVIDTMNELKKFFAEIENTQTLTSILANLDNIAKNLDKTTIKDEAGEIQDTPFRVIENEEFLAAETDAEGKILSATNPDGSHYIHNAKSETIPTEFSHIEDPEGRTEITTDAEGKILGYRDSEGKKHEHSMEIKNLEVSNLNLQGNSVNNIKDALKANGFDVKTPIDWSESSFIQIPEPRFAIINITNIDSMPTTKTDNLHAWMEFWDMQGNYFKKRVIANAQGSSSMGFVKKNIAIDICNDEWIGDDTAKVRFGNLVPQDSFHIKAYYTDFFRGISVVSYHLYEQMQRTLGDMYDKPWKRALIDTDSITTTTKSLGSSFEENMDLQTDTGALCHPDGFPIAVYLNGSFYGVFAMLIKKHRDNYHMNKSKAEHIHLDGTITNSTIFNGKDNINWSAFEIRNPKGLYAIGGNKYDADTKQEEIAGETEINSWIEVGKLPDGTAISSKIKKSLQLTAKVKKYIQSLADAIPNIKAAKDVYEASSKTEEDLNSFKSVYEKYFDSQSMIDYLVFTDTTNNTDGLSKNWQWITYNGEKWYVCVYDCDCTFGGHPLGNQIANVVNWHIHWSDYDTPEGYILKYYLQKMENRYAELSDKGIISSDNIIALVKDWMMRVGTTFYDEEYKKWSDSPCYSNSIIRNEYWELQVDSKGHALTDTSETFDARISYNIGDIVSFGLNENMGYFKFKCIKQTIALSSNTAHAVSSYSPIKEFRHCDNIYRIEKWIEENIKSLDKLYHYARK